MRLSGWKSITTFLSLALFCANCTPEQNNHDGSKTGGDDSHSNAPAVTVGVDKLSAISVVLKGKANLPASVAADLKIGFQYSQSAGILPTNSTTVDAEDADADYNYTTAISGLEPETTYYFRSFVRQNGVDTYGETKSFTTPSLLETLDADNVSETKARMNAKLDLTNVQYKSLEYGFYWGTSESSQNTYVKCSNLSEAAFSYQLGGLTRDKQYWFKTRVVVDSRVFWGEVRSFTTNDIDATVETLDATDVSETKATLNGKLTVISTETWQISVWYLYSNKETTLDELKSSGIKVTSSLENGGSFHFSLSGLTRDNTYCYVAVTKVGDKEFYGELKTLKTKDIDASVTTLYATEVGETKATLNGKLAVNSTETWQKSVWFLYSNEETTLEGLKSSGTKATSTLEGDSSFHSSLSDLIISTTYYYVSVAKVGDKEFYGEVKSFTTNDIEVSVETQDAADVRFTTVSLNGKLTANATESVSKDVWFRYSDKEQTLDGLKSSGKKITSTLESDGSFNSSLTNLIISTTYYYVAVANVGDKEFYGEVKSFTTNDIEVYLETLEAVGVGAKWATLNGRLIINSTEVLPYSVWFLYSIAETTLDGLKSSGRKITSTLESDGSFSKYCPFLKPNSTYHYTSAVKVGGKEFYGMIKSFTTKDYPEVVDLGLSVKWMSTNLGASYPEEYGNFYAWGGVDDDSWFSWSAYKWCNGSRYKLTKYCPDNRFDCWNGNGNPDNKTILDPEDDAAHVMLGGNWRIPTDAEWTELRDNCIWEWVKQDGINGYLVSASNGNSIFLPASGEVEVDNYDGHQGTYYQGKYGFYWSSSLNTVNPYSAYNVVFDSGGVYRVDHDRCCGLSVRPVTK